MNVLGEQGDNLSLVKRAALSHHICLRSGKAGSQEMWTTQRLEEFFSADPRLPSPGQQATSIIRLIGEMIVESGSEIEMMDSRFPALIGSSSAVFALNLLVELKNRGLVTAYSTETNYAPHVQNIGLTLSGWEVFEQERQGQTSGRYGFVALKFGDEILDPLLRDHIKPAIREIGYDLLDLRDVARAGIIDNLLRMQIRDAAFVIVDLTHENAGAYWEAGYAEGLGKPVLYICERNKFDEKKTHFDTNHCTTVLWDINKVQDFRGELMATVRRSLL